MCGIVGVFGQIGVKEETIFKQMLEVDSLRGRHSTGVVKVTADGTVSTKKKAVDGMDFVKLEGAWITQGNNKALIGHNRWATKGAVNDVNAHPFTHGHVHGVHNGTLTSQYGLKDYTKFQVDSDNIFYNIEAEGVETTVTKLRGAFAIAMYDEKEQKVNIFRNSERELAMAIMNDGKTIMIASEFMMLEWVLLRNGFFPDDYKLVELIDTYKLITLEPLAKSKKGGYRPISHTVETKKLEKPKVYVAPTTSRGTSGVQKTLASEGLKAQTYYPAKLISSRDVAGTTARRHLLQLEVYPYTKVNLNTYSKQQHDNLAVLGEQFEIKVNPAYAAGNLDTGIDFISYSCDHRPLTEKGKQDIADDVAERLAEREARKKAEEEEDVPFSKGKTKA